jgi:hypothetical protein
MRLLKYTEGWTRRHFLEQVGKGVFAAGVVYCVLRFDARTLPSA